MAIIHSCCCWKSLRTGSFACGIYSLFYYFVLVVVGTFHVDTWGTPFDNNTVALSLGQDTEVARPVSIVIIICSAITIVASIILLVGLRMDNRIMLIPWVFMISVTTLVDFVYTAYSIGTTVIYPAFAAIVTIDFFICLLNIYCIVCVVSQYQEYKEGRGTALHDLQMRTFGGVVDFSAIGDRVQFLHGKPPTNLPPKVVAMPGIRRVPQAGHVNGHHQQQQHVASKVLGPISECSNGDEVPLNGVVADVINDHVTLDAIGGPRSQPPPPRLVNKSDAWKSAALVVDDEQDVVSCRGVGDGQNSTAIDQRRSVKFSPVVVESFALGSKAVAVVVDDNDSDAVIKMVVSSPMFSSSESSSTTSASCDPEHSHDSCKSTEPISHEADGFALNSAYNMNSESSSDQRFSNATTTTHETLPLLNQTTDGTT